MKGTLFSADFIKDSNNNLRLLELNTDTGFISESLSHFDYTELFNIISSSNITEFVVLGKLWQADFVEHLSQSLNTDLPSVSFQSIYEESSTIYPTSIEDADSKFILRLAYDESALFDSEYCKDTTNTLKLFTDNNDSGSVAEYYHSSSTDGVLDYLPHEFNSTLSPDVVIKSQTTTTNDPISFVKISKPSLSDDDRYTELKSSTTSDELIIKFYETSNDPSLSIRNYSIIYGSNLDVINIGSFETPALLDKPTVVDSGSLGDTDIRNSINMKHYYEFSTNSPRYGTVGNYGGIFEEEDILKSDDTYVLISSASVGDELKSYFISGSPDTDLETEYTTWSYPGNELPSGSYLTSSVLINSVDVPITYNIVNRITLDGGDEFRISGGSYLLVYESSSDSLKYVSAGEIETTNHSLLRKTGGTIAITSNTIDILDGEYSNYIIDIESTDTFFVRAGDAQIKIVTHNCFPAGTKITLADGTQKNIEDLTTEDKLLTYNESNGQLSEGTIGNIAKKKEFLLIEITAEDNTHIKSTSLHKFHIVGKGWVSAQDIELGDTLLKSDGSEVKVTDKQSKKEDIEVFHILDVKDNHTYFAEGVLVHNFKYTCFIYESEVEMWDGTTKQIGEIKVGDEVKSIKNGEVVKGIVTDHLIHPINDVVPFSQVGNIIGDSKHPVMVNGEWIDFGQMENAQNGFKFIDNYYNLEIDGNDIDGSEHNFIMDGLVVSGLGDNKELNTKFMRQSKELLTNAGII